MNKMKLLLTLAAPVLLFQAAQAQSSRLTAQAHWTHNGAEFKKNDSTAYMYGATSRGGDLKNQLKFDDATSWTYAFGDTLNNNMRYLQDFDASNNLNTRVEQQWDMMLMTWVNTWKYVYTYTSGNKVASKVTQHWDGTSAWITDARNVYTYNSANQLSQDQYQLWDGVSSYVPSTQVTYYYDASGNLINETSVTFVSTSPVFTTQVNYTFNTSNKELTATHSTWNGASWDNVEMFTNTYDSTGNRTTRMHQNFDGVSFVNDMLHVYSSFAGSNPQSEVVQSWDTAGAGSWMDMHKFAHSYNGSGQLTSSTRQSNDISIGWTYTFGDTKDVYYYGTFVSVKNVANNGGNATLFPVPAQNLLNIDLNWNQAQATTITVVDMQGRVINTQTLAVGAKQHAAISVADMADGIYMVKINGTNGQIVKQIVVAH